MKASILSAFSAVFLTVAGSQVIRQQLPPVDPRLPQLDLSRFEVPIDLREPEDGLKLEARKDAPTVKLEDGSIITGSVLADVESFKGIPFAEPPLGDLRMRPPVRLEKPLGKFDASMRISPQCPQMFFSSSTGRMLTQVIGNLLNKGLFQKILDSTEDCLNINVQRPKGVKAGDKLPVLFWIFGGGFELGSNAMYSGTPILTRAMEQGQPFIFVGVNYRVGGFGFMPGEEIQAEGSGNAGLLDQRMGMEWVADNIEAFGGDPDKVTIWGESAGAISVFDQMALYDGNATYKGKPLFRAAIMNSGSIIPADPVDCPKGREVYNQVVKAGGCSGRSDTLKCLRELPYEKFLKAANAPPGLLSYNSVALSYLPRPDGKVLRASPDVLLLGQRYYPVPMIIGDQEDEGSIFALFQHNLTNTEMLVGYLKEIFFPATDIQKIKDLVKSYPDDPREGSPFRTGKLNQVYPQFKRLAAILGDITFTLTRRLFLFASATLHPDVPSWSYLSSYDYGTPIAGTFHGSDLLQVFYGILPNYASRTTVSYYTNFLYNLDPNEGIKVQHWPKWMENQELLNMNANDAKLIPDNFRNESYNYLLANFLSFYI
ncbi:lipase 4 [Pyricularia oryzae 70-15]|uniref:Carboxylic ester hydrolase n=1 Tax=Pyricularia oryzae (strain 70-15 / ATCC MYA-4617 / FGSC 8958) TaxID=242507 RepID=G4NCZ9_PYRO7|nr:lipase 4 [Pyricularia oryzae 70-15]EHA49189.1 lipase 4 [Pyricularia oryzae 70-15]